MPGSCRQGGEGWRGLISGRTCAASSGSSKANRLEIAGKRSLPWRVRCLLCLIGNLSSPGLASIAAYCSPSPPSVLWLVPGLQTPQGTLASCLGCWGTVPAPRGTAAHQGAENTHPCLVIGSEGTVHFKTLSSSKAAKGCLHACRHLACTCCLVCLCSA